MVGARHGVPRGRGSGGEAPAPVAVEPASDPRPPLRVVHLGPDGGGAVAEAPYDAGVADVPEGRVSIRSTPNGLVQEDASAPGASRAKTMSATEKKPKPAANSTKSAPSKPDAAKKN